jgi:hypothetical protein
MRCSDGHLYVVKFQNNPQHLRVLANELFATRLAKAIGLPVPETDIVQVEDWLIQHTPELKVELPGKTIACCAGMQFGSRYACPPHEGIVYDYLPEKMLAEVRNIQAFYGMLALDKWTCNANGRQAAFWKKGRERKFTATFIDQGYCFNAGEWTFPDAPLRGVYGRNDVYRDVVGMKSFEPWLSRIESFDETTIGTIAEIVPPEWYGEWDDLGRLVEMLIRRRCRVHELILSFKNSSRNPFPNWKAEVVN